MSVDKSKSTGVWTRGRQKSSSRQLKHRCRMRTSELVTLFFLTYIAYVNRAPFP